MAKNTTFSRLIKYLLPSLHLVILTVILSSVTVISTLFVPVLIGDAIDCIVGQNAVDFTLLGEYAVKIAICVGITALLQWLSGIINNSITYNTVQRIRKDAFYKIKKLPFSYIDGNSYGDIVNRVISDVEQVGEGLLMGFTRLFTGALTIVATVAFMLYLNWIIAIAVALITPLSLFVAKFIATSTYSLFKIQSKTRGEQTAFVDEMIGNLKTVKAFSMEEDNEVVFDEINGRLEKASLKAIFFSSLTNPCTRFVNSVVYALVALVGAIFVILGGGGAYFTLWGINFKALTVGGLTKFLSYATQYTKPFNDISEVITEFQNALASASRVFEFIDAEEEISDKDNIRMPKAEGDIELKEVSFSYNKDKRLIENLNLSVKSGQRVAIVGPTGCGKTTLINLLMRFYDADKGCIYVDGNSVRDVTRSSLRKNYGMVLQDTWLKIGTVKDNIKMGREDASDEEVIAAAKAAHAHSFIVRLKDGYDTVIGEDGGSLSQGQKQLLCITRIMLALPPMLILDEATSSIDTRTEIRIQRAFAKLMRGRTSFIVAHRLSTVKNADIILVMKDGKIIEQGTHSSLLERNGFYDELYKSQFAR